MSRIELRRMIQALVVLACALTSVTSRSEGIGDALDKLKRSLPVDIQEAVKKKVDVPAAQPAEAGRPTTQSQSSSIKFPVPPCVSYSNVSARGAMAELTNGCGFDVTILNAGKGGTCSGVLLKIGMTLLAAPVAVCDRGSNGVIWKAPVCACEGLAKTGDTVSAPTPKAGSNNQAASASCIATVQSGGSEKLKNMCDRDLSALEKTSAREGCKLTKFNRRFMASGETVAICDGGQKGKSCDCASQTIWRHP